MLIGVYKLPDLSVVIEVHHNRAEVFQDDQEPMTFHFYEDIAEIMSDIGKEDQTENLIYEEEPR